MLQVSESSDRLKRERWMDQKAKKIKDQTVRSLESEVQKIMNRLDNMFENSPYSSRSLLVRIGCIYGPVINVLAKTYKTETYLDIVSR